MTDFLMPVVEDAVSDLRAGLSVYWPAKGLK
jgi:hypothetical protein